MRLVVFLLLAVSSANSVAALYPVTPYTSFSDSPLSSVANFSYFYLEDFEDASADTPGWTFSVDGPGPFQGPGSSRLRPPGPTTDSVDADDGVVDSLGNGGHSFVIDRARFSIFFDANPLGSLPTHVGLVLTDLAGTGSITVTIFDDTGSSVGTVSVADLSNTDPEGDTAEDRFVGATHASGISRIFVSTVGTVEFDHLQYGHAGANPGPRPLIPATPYTSISDSPLPIDAFESFFLEDFEDSAIDVPGIRFLGDGPFYPSEPPGIVEPSPTTDSVDEDDGALDGSGVLGHSYAINRERFSISFDPAALGGYPSHAGFVVTDLESAGGFSIEAFDQNGASLGRDSLVLLGDLNAPPGQTAEDRFLGAVNPAGISALQVIARTGYEIDHLQYGFMVGAPPVIIPPSSYLSFADSPFASFADNFPFVLEDVEDGAFDPPGVTERVDGPFTGAFSVSLNSPGGDTDSVDADDGAIDGLGQGGWSRGVGRRSYSLSFSTTPFGSLPTHVGLVVTDMASPAGIRFEVFDENGVRIAINEMLRFGDSETTGQTAEDRFVGFRNEGGISRIAIFANSSFEFDHLQYSTAPVVDPDIVTVTSSSSGSVRPFDAAANDIVAQVSEANLPPPTTGYVPLAAANRRDGNAGDSFSCDEADPGASNAQSRPFVSATTYLDGVDEVTFDNCNSAWFQFPINFPTGFVPTSWRLRANVDDMAVAYINGQSITGLLANDDFDTAIESDNSPNGVDANGRRKLIWPNLDIETGTVDASLFGAGGNNVTIGVIGDASELEPTGVEFELTIYGYDSADDSDGDGLSDPDEILRSTDPLDSDSDGDGLSDGDEINVWFTDPLNPDSDGDGRTDGDEVSDGTDPTIPDAPIPLPGVWLLAALLAYVGARHRLR